MKHRHPPPPKEIWSQTLVIHVIEDTKEKCFYCTVSKEAIRVYKTQLYQDKNDAIKEVPPPSQFL